MLSLKKELINEISKLKSKNLYRNLKAPEGLDFSSNDYLCLSKNPKILKELKKGIELFGAGSTASRLIRGHRTVFDEVEFEFARFVGSESAIFLSNGFVSNLGLIDAIGNTKTLIFTDRLNHASILDGIRISGGQKKYFNHKDLDHLSSQLKKSDHSKPKIIISETIFSMDGDVADVKELINLKKEYNATLILDEAHALGVFGVQGSGISKMENYLEKEELSEIDFRVYTGGKAMGLEGAFIACSEISREFLINKMRTFIFSTAPMPCIAFTLKKSIQLIKDMENERERILSNASLLRENLKTMGFDTLQTHSQIIPVIMENEIEALNLSQFLFSRGYDIRAIRPPTVKQARLRISINSKIKKKDIYKLLETIKDYKKERIFEK